MKYVDIGLNLFSSQFKGQEDEIMTRAGEAGVFVIVTGSSLKSSIKAAASGYPFTAGIHPHDASSWDEHTAEALEGLLKGERRPVAAGECGLDYDRMFSPKDKQLECFEEQIKLSIKYDLPLFLHERDAADDFYDMLKKYPEAAQRSVVHCFTGNAENVKRYLSLGCMIGITGWICDERRNGDLKEAVKHIPVCRLLTETDGPYLLPRGIKGLKNPNVPGNVVWVLKKLAELKNMDEEELRLQVLDNLKKWKDRGDK